MDSKLIIGGCCRNVASHLEAVLRNIKEIGNLFTDYYCIFVESDSDDNTLEILKQFEQDHQDKCNVISVGKLSNVIHTRTQRLAICRNTILRKTKEIKDCKYLLMMDMDDIGSALIDMGGVKSNFKDLNWSVMSASNPINYYDIWALRWPDVIDYDCWFEIRKDGNYQKHVAEKTILAAKPITAPPILVKSAFNGAAFYKLDDIKDCCVYTGILDNHEICEHVLFHECIRSHGGTIYINPSFVINYC